MSNSDGTVAEVDLTTSVVGSPITLPAGGEPLATPIVFGASTTTSARYWLFSRDGGVFNFGDAPFRGSLAGTALTAPIVGGVGF